MGYVIICGDRVIGLQSTKKKAFMIAKNIEMRKKTNCVVAKEIPCGKVNKSKYYPFALSVNHIPKVKISSNNTIKCPLCGKVEPMAQWTYLKAGFGGIKAGDNDDIDKFECSHCGKVVDGV